MNVYQVIKQEYDSDDGHYDSDQYGETVYRYEAKAVQVRDGLNAESIEENNAQMAKEVARRKAQWEANGKIEPPVVNRHGTQYHDLYSTKGIKQFAETRMFVGDPTDVKAVEAFANRHNCLTYFTIETLVVT